MGVMTNFQKKKTADPNHGTGRGENGFKVIATMPGSAIAKQQAVAAFDKELEADLETLKFIKSIKQKEREKAEHLVPKYMPVVQNLIAAGSAHPILGQILVWLFDTKDIHTAMDLAVYCIAHEVVMPERFKRDLPTYLCDVVLEWAEQEFKAGRSVEPYFEQICTAAQGFDLPDQVTAKMYRLKGLIAAGKEDFEQAVIALKKAEEYGAMVKTALAQATKKLETAKEK
ncbi:MAG: phage terminase small subunit [Desulforhopalus sp.]